MISSAVLTILIFSITSALMGLLLLRIGLRGKQISPNPHCRKCKFDLSGLNLTDPTPCPECGITLRTNTPAITPGLRKKRKLVLLAAFLFLFTAATGFAWPKLSKLPSIQSINIYDHFPESFLVKLATTGDDSALQVLHDRLIPGKVSDAALQSLIDHAFRLQADESVPWDERWGDVLIYSFLSELMSHDQSIAYIEGAFQFQVFIHPEIDREVEDVAVWFEHKSPSRGTSNVSFRHAWSRATKGGPFPGDIDTPYQFTISKDIPSGPGPNSKRSGTGGSGVFDPDRAGWWIPYQSGGASMGTSVRVPRKRGSFDCTFIAKIKVYKEDTLFHTWDIDIVTHTNRVDHPEYIELITEPLIVKDIASALTCSPIRVPASPEEAKKHKDIRDSVPSQFAISSSIPSPHGLLGTLWLRNGDDELEFANLTVTIKERVMYSFSGPYQFGSKDQTWLDFYINNEEFWTRALERGSVDVIYRPDPSMAAKDPRLETMIGLPIIFHDVPLVKLIPKLKPIVQGRNGPTVDTWTMSPINEMEPGRSYTLAQAAQFRGPEGVAGELMEDDED